MIKKKLDENRILLVAICKNKAEAEKQTELLNNTAFNIPAGHTCSMHVIVGKKNLAATINEVQKKDNSKYKIYITSPVAHVDNSLIMKTAEAFFFEPKTAMVGMMGSEIPVNGDYTQAKNFYGIYAYQVENSQIQNYIGKDPLYYQSVHMVESSFFATNEDIQWDEKIGDDFAVAAQCCNFRSKGYDVGIFYQERPLLIFARDEFDYKPKIDVHSYTGQLEKFRTFYYKKFQPLVSILIPTYNQPKFFQQALESALGQTYQNIEILVGDDSTNEDTKKLIRPYLKKYSNLKYFYHDGKIPRGGGANMYFLMNHCAGEYVNYLLHDDLFHPEKIEKMMQYCITDFDDRIGLVTSARNLIDENNNLLHRQNPWQPHNDAIIKGNEVGRRLLFIIANFIGELTTVLFRKKHLEYIEPRTGRKYFASGTFCGVASSSYGDMDTWMEILKTEKDMVFMAEPLSVFRRHAAQNTFNPNTRITLPLDALNFITLAWLNDVFFRNVEEFNYCIDKWPILADRWFKPVAEDDPDIVKKRKEWIIKLKTVILSGDREKIIDAAITHLLDSSPQVYGVVLTLIRKNRYSGLWEKNKNIYYELKNLDEVETNRWFACGSFAVSKKNAKFGKALQLNNDLRLALPNVSFGGEDFAIAGWAYVESSSLAQTIFGVGDDSVAFVLKVDGSGKIQFATGSIVESVINLATRPAVLNQLFHFELDYINESQTFLLFINGTKIYEAQDVNFATSRIFKHLLISMNPLSLSAFMSGAIDDFLVVRGKTLHTENFEVPDKPYETDEYTVSLLHFD